MNPQTDFLAPKDQARSRTVTTAMRLVLAISMTAMMAFGAISTAEAQTPKPVAARSDAVLVKSLPGFENGYADVNGTRLHYVVGGEGAPLVLLPGWPQTWWQFHKIMPTLAKSYRVIAVDLRGMGGSSKPPAGYDKKNMAKDIRELVQKLGYDKVHMAGHDIGAMVAFSYAANYPEATTKLALLDVPHPDDFFSQLTMLPGIDKFGEKIDEAHPPYAWWFAFNQVKGLPEKLLAGRFNIYQDWMLNYLTLDPASIPASDRAVYAAAYSTPDAVRAGNGWYQTFMQDVIDVKTYPKLAMPVLGLGSTGYYWLQASVTPKVNDFQLVKVENSGHFMAEEQPAFVAESLRKFFK